MKHTAKNSQAAKSTAAKPTETQKSEALCALRTETALSRFPIHCIAKKTGDIGIQVQSQGAVQWTVSHNVTYGPAGPLAYRLDTLLVNRRIEEAGRPLPRLIRLGTLPEIAEELGLARGNWELLRRALHQNASAYITAKVKYNAADGSERFLEAGFNRYNVVFTGEKLPSGLTASAVHITLSDIYREVLDTAQWRPLDYGYMRSLTPAAQRFYEIVSYQIYAALHHRNPRAKLAYSEYCLLSTATRYLEFDQVKKQMYKILRPHIQSGYLAKIEYEAIINERNEPDWIMYLTPGENASREYHAFTEAAPKLPKARKAPAKRAAENDPRAPMPPFETAQDAPPSKPALAKSGAAGEDDPDTRELIALLIGADLNRSDAQRFAREQPEVCRRQLGYLPYVSEFKSSRGAYLRRAIEGDFGPPAAYARQQARQETKTASEGQRKQERDDKSYQKARLSHEKALCGPFQQYLRERVGEASERRPEASMAFLDQEAAQRSTYTSGPLAGRPLTLKALEVFDREASRLERARLFWCKQGLQVLDFWEWDQSLNPKPFESNARRRPLGKSTSF